MSDDSRSLGPLRMPPTVDADAFKGAFRHHAAGVAVVTADLGDGPLALTASSVTSVSADPAVLLFSVATTSDTGRALAQARTAVVHLLDASDLDLAVRCATPGLDRFADPAWWDRLPTGEPVFVAPRRILRGEVVLRQPLGEATVLVLAVVEVLDRGDGAAGREPTPRGPLAYHDRHWHVLGEGSRLN
jgi:flavin reductase (DIM6/NTAB) family NADH-FMN oxidoreductase RutF